MKTWAICVGLVLGASWAFGGAGGRSITLDINQQDRAFSNTVSRGEAFDWEVYLTRGGAAYTNETITGGGVYYSTSRTATAWVVFPFSSWSASGGRVVCRMDATNSMGLSTNSADYPIAYYASIILTTANNVYRWRQGILTITDDGAVSGSGIAAASLTMVPNSRTLTINGVTYDLSANRSWTVSTTATLPAGTVAATNQGVAGQSLFWNAGSPTGVSTGYWATAAGSGDMLASVYDPGSVQRGVVFTNDQRVTLALTNGALYATAAQGAKADTALQPADTNGWTVSSHASFLTAESDPVFATNGVTKADTNTWTVSTHSGLLISGVGGATINGEPITNGASFTITGGGGADGGISNISVAGVSGTLTGSGSNVVASVSLASLAGAGVVTNDQSGVRFGMVTSDTFQAASSAGWAIKANNGMTCISGGAGGGCNVTIANGTTVNGLLTANGGFTSTGTVNVLGGGNVVTNGQKIAASTNADYATVSGTASNLVGAQSNRLEAAITNAVVKAITVYSITNPVITLSESANAWNWTPPTNVPLSCTFSGPGAGWAGSGMLRLVRTNGDNSVSWPTNATFFVNGTRTTNAPTLSNYNRFVVDYFDGMWTLGLVSTNSVSL
jgi:hypothetical protein